MDLLGIFQTYYIHFQELASNSIFQHYGLVGLLINAILSSTALPIPTEPLIASLLSGGENKINVGVIVFIGTVIGGIINYFIGYGGGKLGHLIKLTINKNPKPKDVKNQSLVEKILKKAGWAGIFFSPFIPIIGDLILITCGSKHYDFKKYLLLMISGKVFKTAVTIFGLGILFH